VGWFDGDHLADGSAGLERAKAAAGRGADSGEGSANRVGSRQAFGFAVDFRMASARPQAPLKAVLFREWTLPDGTLWAGFYRTEAGYLLRFPGLADFQLAQDGGRIRCRPVLGVAAATVRHLYLNQVLPLALCQQGKLVLHASAVEIGGEAVACVGVSGRGKSTLAASFATGGYRFLSDDGLVVEPVAGEPHVVPCHPSIRLWEDSQAALVGAGARRAPPLPFTSKARLLAGASVAFCGQPRRLRQVYFLGAGEQCAPAFERMSPAEALIELVKHSFLLDLDEPAPLAAHFNALAELARRPIFHRLDYPRRYADLPEVRRAIVKHACGEEGTA